MKLFPGPRLDALDQAVHRDRARLGVQAGGDLCGEHGKLAAGVVLPRRQTRITGSVRPSEEATGGRAQVLDLTWAIVPTGVTFGSGRAMRRLPSSPARTLPLRPGCRAASTGWWHLAGASRTALERQGPELLPGSLHQSPARIPPARPLGQRGHPRAPRPQLSWRILVGHGLLLARPQFARSQNGAAPRRASPCRRPNGAIASTLVETNRLEAFSDAVVAILITIMVLELKIPHGSSIKALKPLVPIGLTYVLSFANLGIYWNNHHHLLQLTEKVNGKVLWANLHLLFWLSLFPVATGWVGLNGFATAPTAGYGVVLLLAADRVLHLGGHDPRGSGPWFPTERSTR